MSYRSYYDLKVQKLVGKELLDISEEEHNNIISILRGNNSNAFYAMRETGKNKGEASSWYNYREDLIEFSKKFPDYIFYMYREGEGNADVEENYILNGVMQTLYATLVIPPFDPNFYNPPSVQVEPKEDIGFGPVP
ncbi:MAG TPA: hypothetical protein PLR64_00550 [Candidatus Dojkabacteria bacterium]|nr:hypothetical protein [Candidatus Dojkabacteria bacterium]